MMTLEIWPKDDQQMALYHSNNLICIVKMKLLGELHYCVTNYNYDSHYFTQGENENDGHSF